MKLRNVSPLGDLDIPLMRRTIEHGEEFEATADQAANLLLQPANFEPADDAAEALARVLRLPAQAAAATTGVPAGAVPTETPYEAHAGLTVTTNDPTPEG